MVLSHVSIALAGTSVSLDFSLLYADNVYHKEKIFKGTVKCEASDSPDPQRDS